MGDVESDVLLSDAESVGEGDGQLSVDVEFMSLDELPASGELVSVLLVWSVELAAPDAVAQAVGDGALVPVSPHPAKPMIVTAAVRIRSFFMLAVFHRYLKPL